MLLKFDQRSEVGTPGILSDKQRVVGTAAALIKFWERHPHGTMVMHELWLQGEPKFITTMRVTIVPGSLAEAFTDAQWGEVYELIDYRIRKLAEAGAKWRKRRGDKVSKSDIRNGKFMG